MRARRTDPRPRKPIPSDPKEPTTENPKLNTPELKPEASNPHGPRIAASEGTWATKVAKAKSNPQKVFARLDLSVTSCRFLKHIPQRGDVYVLKVKFGYDTWLEAVKKNEMKANPIADVPKDSALFKKAGFIRASGYMFDGQETMRVSQLMNALDGVKPGDPVTIQVLRRGEYHTHKITEF